MLINDLSRRLLNSRPFLDDAIRRVMDRSWFVLGPEVVAFEKAFAAYIGAPHCVGLANGTDAIELALKAFGVGQADLVATVANAGMYTTTALLAIGAEPLFLDVNVESRNVTLSEVQRALDTGVKAIVVTHLYGLAVPEITEIATLCRARNVKLLEDCAQSHGARLDGHRVGTFGDAASFSFYPTKNLGALGDGGAVVTNDVEVAECVKRLRQYGWSDKYQVEIAGARNSRLDEIQAAVLSEFLPDLDAANVRRRSIATRYSASISHSSIKVSPTYGEEFVAHLYTLRAANRDSLRQHLKTCDIATDVHYPIPDYLQPAFGSRYAHVQLPNTEQLCHEILTLPCFPEMTDVEVAHVIAKVNAW
ncbi:MAG: DegT/DnrJ/EryC1/StrS family aminotransferase [Rhodoferax sp.]|uniref:DegT/DnrJ/EryC1/StrS family aminotransferase n=1 Tax=Rhodoferax sp. TaxID=50421 RepID=UPI0026342F4A|nr:DegT/DnrJ/EryC1/StrS family aminotransferase [Rhodoferax sp.]MDD2881509.1 DegT/DnrJ/EryC1/StrS family aminotransferase [Rhodoferax sp.]